MGYEVRRHVNAGFHVYDPQPVDCYIHYRTQKTGWQIAQVMGLQANAELRSRPHTIRMLDLGRRYNV